MDGEEPLGDVPVGDALLERQRDLRSCRLREAETPEQRAWRPQEPGPGSDTSHSSNPALPHSPRPSALLPSRPSIKGHVIPLFPADILKDSPTSWHVLCK